MVDNNDDPLKSTCSTTLTITTVMYVLFFLPAACNAFITGVPGFPNTPRPQAILEALSWSLPILMLGAVVAPWILYKKRAYLLAILIGLSPLLLAAVLFLSFLAKPK
jgi:hypothetical protein